MSSPDHINQLRNLGAATVHEAQGATRALDSGIKPIDPTSRLAGPAVTVDLPPGDNLMLHYALTKAKAGDVLVVDAKGFVEAGPWGDVMTHAAQVLGIAGLVINGAVRDANQIIDLEFPVFCRGLSIKGTAKNQPGKVNVPVCIGGVVIHPGDFVVGDRDGVVVVRRDEVDATLRNAAAREEKEIAFRKELDRGRTTVDLLGLGDTLNRLGLV
jgi:4-hydroxy-4-methyl-2-oxoglutarate aldolase